VHQALPTRVPGAVARAESVAARDARIEIAKEAGEEVLLSQIRNAAPKLVRQAAAPTRAGSHQGGN